MDNRDLHDPFVPPPDDDDELQLEAPDERVEARRRADILGAQEARIDIEEIYREAERNRGDEILQQWFRNFQFRFGLRELLVATPVVAIAVALAELELFWTAVILLFMFGVGGLYFYLTLQERKHQAEVARKRDEIYAKRREKFSPRAPGISVNVPVADPAPITADDEKTLNDIEQIVPAATPEEPFRFQFSMRELVIAVTVAAIALAMIRFAGGAKIAPTLLGAVALVGLVAFATNFKPPQIVVFGWWVILMMYVVFTVFGFMFTHLQ